MVERYCCDMMLGQIMVTTESRSVPQATAQDGHPTSARSSRRSERRQSCDLTTSLDQTRPLPLDMCEGVVSFVLMSASCATPTLGTSPG